MITAFIAAAVLVLCAFAELLFPGRDLYHYGWFNVLLAALAALAIAPLRGVLRTAEPRARLAAVAVVAGGVAAAFAAIASGLLGPDTQTVVAAPGASVRIDALGGSLAFPLVSAHGDDPSDVLLVRGNRPASIGSRRFNGPFLLQPVNREVVSVDVTDARGAHLTITQPTGNTFLSPVLLMQTTQTIAGMELPYDTFAVPAAHRIVKAVLFDANEAARLPALAGANHAVLFDVENEREVSLKDGIGVSRDDQTVTLAGLQLKPRVFAYPAIRVVSVPDYRIVVAAAVLLLAGLLLTRARRTV